MVRSRRSEMGRDEAATHLAVWTVALASGIFGYPTILHSW